MMLAFPKPSQKKSKPKYLGEDGVFRYPDGREVCQLTSKKGMDEYLRRIRLMTDRQGKMCCLRNHIKQCPGRLNYADATFEHEDGRGHGGGHRDDRIEKPDPKTGEMKPYNGAAHRLCNSLKGSRRINYNLIDAI